MKQTTLGILLACLTAGAGAQQEPRRIAMEVQRGEAPRVEVLARSLEQPKAYGMTEEIHIGKPRGLTDRIPEKSAQDPLAAGFSGLQAPAAGLSFEGYSNDDNVTLFGTEMGVPDAEGDVGKDYYVQWNNKGWSYYSKSDGAQVGGPYPGNVFWQGFGGYCESDNVGDPIVLYDHLAERWLFSQIVAVSHFEGHQCFAISQSSDPAGPYYLYDFVVSPDTFNDYPKIGVWPDGYYLTTNQYLVSYLFSDFTGVYVTAFERDRMLAGESAQMVQAELPDTGTPPMHFSVQPAHLEGGSPPPAPGRCAPLAMAFDDELYGDGTGPDGYQLWEYCVDWQNPTASSLVTGPLLATAEFTAAFNPIPQAGTAATLGDLGPFTMYRFSTRHFPGAGLKGVLTHDVDDAGVNSVRWAELDLSSLATAQIVDSGTLDGGDGLHRWIGSAAIDKFGNLGLVYARSGATSFPSVYFTGREPGDPAGTMRLESTCVDGTGSQTTNNRSGDYATMSVDPEDGCTFWATNMYTATSGNFNWSTRVCSFCFPACGDCEGSGGGGEDPVTLTLTGLAAEDGWVREKNENSNTGKTIDASDSGSQAIRAGDDRRDRQYLSIVSFDTSQIPAGASIQSAKLRLLRGGVTGTDPLTTHGSLLVDVGSGGFGGSTALQSSDFQAAATAAGAAVMLGGAADETWAEGTLDASGLAAVDTSGTTQLRVAFTVDDNDDGGNDYVGFYSADHATAAKRPQLVVTYLP